MSSEPRPSETYKKSFIFQIAAIVAVILILGLVDFLFHNTILQKIKDVGPPSANVNYSGESDLNFQIKKAMANSKPIIIWGSCELTNSEQVPELAHVFLTQKFHIPIFAFGHGGMQSLAIAAQLSAYHQNLPSAKQVIILSPEWFNEDEWRLNISSFFEFVPTSILAQIYFDPATSQDLLKSIGHYLAVQSDITVSPSWTVRALWSEFGGVRFRFWPKTFLRAMAWVFDYLPSKFDEHTAIYRMLAKNRNLPQEDLISASKFDWQKERKVATLRYEKETTRNLFGFLDRYNDEIFKDQGPWPKSLARARTDGPEFQDFELLLEVLVAANNHPLFILQAFNERAYTNTQSYQELVQLISDRLKKAEMPFLNLWQKNSRELGRFWGPVQTGDLSWIDIDQSILDTFYGIKPNEHN